MNICFRLEHVFHDRSTDLENSYVLRALLDCLTQINLSFISRQRVPRLYQSGVRYSRTKLWYPTPELYQRGRGDCKSLAPALVAEYLNQGIVARPVFRFVRNDHNAGNLFHILVMVPNRNGYDRKLYEDPSAKLGMGRDELKHFY